MAINDVFELVLGMTQSGQKMVNRFYYKQDGADGGLAPEEALKNAFVLTMVPAYQAVTCTALSFETIRIRKVQPVEGGSFVWAVDEPGTIVEDPIPPNGVVIIAFFTSLLTRQGRGRMHVSGIPDSWTEHGVLFATQYALYDVLADLFVAQLPAAGGNPAFDCGLKGALAADFKNISEARPRNRVFTLRSRSMENP